MSEWLRGAEPSWLEPWARPGQVGPGAWGSEPECDYLSCLLDDWADGYGAHHDDDTRRRRRKRSRPQEGLCCAKLARRN